MVAVKKKKIAKALPARGPDTFKVILCYRIHSAPREPSQSTNLSEELWHRHNGPFGLYPIAAKPWANVKKEVLLPFAPFPGLRIDVAGIDGGIPIAMVSWRVDDKEAKNSGDLSAGYFQCTFEDQFPKPEERITYDKLKEYAVESCWEVREFGLS